MHRTLLPIALILLSITAIFAVPRVRAQGKASGEVDLARCWSYPFDDGRRLAADGARLFAAGPTGRIEAVSLDGKKMWSSELGGEIASNLVPYENTLLLATSAMSAEGSAPASSVLRSLSKETGITGWTAKLPDARWHFVATANGSLLVVSASGVMQAFDPNGGALKWRREVAAGFIGAPVLYGGKAYVASTAKQVFVVTMVSGEIESMVKVDFSVTSLGVAPNGSLMTGDERGRVASLPNGGEKANWKFKTGGSIAAIVAARDNMLAASNDNFVYFLASGNGGLMWKKRLPGRASHLGVIAGKYLLVTAVEEHGATLLDLTNGKIAGQIPLRADEVMTSAPVEANEHILVLTNTGLHAYKIGGCVQKQEAVPGT